MEKKITDQKPDQTPPEMIENAAPSEVKTAAASGKEEKPQPGRLQRFFRKVLIWLVIIVIAFTAGMAADHFLRYKPLSDGQDETLAALDLAQQDLGDLQADIDQLNNKNQTAGETITALEEDKNALQDELETTTAHLKLFQVLVDVSNARVALFLDDIEEAKATLLNTQERLENLLPRIAEFDPALAQDMPQRLNLIISGLDRDIETVIIDLDLITRDLLEIEEMGFGE